jgi:hypothetical protein
LDEEKSKNFAGLAQQNGLWPTFLQSLLRAPTKKPKLPEKSVIYFWYVKPLARQCS